MGVACDPSFPERLGRKLARCRRLPRLVGQKLARDRRVLLIACASLLFALPLAFGLARLNAAVSQAIRCRTGGSESSAATASYPAGWWLRYTNSSDGYSLALPPAWRALSLDSRSLEQYKESDSPEAQLARRLAEQVQPLIASGAGAWAAVAPEAELEVTTLNIIRQPLERPLSVEAFARSNLSTLREEEDKPRIARQQWLELVEGRALRVEMIYQPDPDEDGAPLHITQYYLVNEQNGFVVTAVTRQENAEGYSPIFDGIVRSLRWMA